MLFKGCVKQFWGAVMNQASRGARIDEGRSANVAILNPLVQEITEALLALGGAAHRDAVVAQVAKRRGVFRPSPAMGQELDAAFSTYCSGASDRHAAGLLHLPYGPLSRRWALTEQAYGLLRDGADSGMR